MALNAAQVRKAVDALLEHKRQSEKPNQLLTDEDHVLLVLSFHSNTHFPTNHIVHRIVIPHPYTSPDATEMCLFSATPQRKFKDIVAANSDLSCIKRVIDVPHLRKKYKTFEQKRQLYKSYELFLADVRVLKRLPAVLGKAFMYREKMPVSVHASTDEALTSSVKLVAQYTTAKLHRNSAMCTITVGNTGIVGSDLVENIMEVWKVLQTKEEVKTARITAAFVKLPSSVSLQIYALKRTEKSEPGQSTGKKQKTAVKREREEEAPATVTNPAKRQKATPPAPAQATVKAPAKATPAKAPAKATPAKAPAKAKAKAAPAKIHGKSGKAHGKAPSKSPAKKSAH